MKNLCLILPTMLLAFPAFAQEKNDGENTPAQGFSLSAMAGPTLSNMPFNPGIQTEGGEINTNAEVSFFAGLSGQFRFKKDWAFHLEAQYAQKGYRWTAFAEQQRYRLAYLDLMPQAAYHFSEKFSASIGGYWAHRISEKVKNGDQDWIKVDPDLAEIVNDNDFGAVLGLTASFGRLSALLRYQHGLSRASGSNFTDDSGQLSQTRQHNRTVQFGLGFRLF